MSSSENMLPPTPPTPHGPLLAPSHHRTSSTLQRHLETALAPATLNKRSASVTDQIELEEWWSLTPERLRRIFKEVDVDNDGRLPFACLVDSLRSYDLAAQEQDVSDTLVKLRSPSSDGEDDFSRAWRRKSTTEVTEDEFLAAAKQLMVAKVFAAARRKKPLVSLVDFGLDDIDIGDDIEVTKAWLARLQRSGRGGSRSAATRRRCACSGSVRFASSSARRCIKTVAATEGGARIRDAHRDARADCGAPVRCTWRRSSAPGRDGERFYICCWRVARDLRRVDASAGLVAARARRTRL